MKKGSKLVIQFVTMIILMMTLMIDTGQSVWANVGDYELNYVADDFSQYASRQEYGYIAVFRKEQEVSFYNPYYGYNEAGSGHYIIQTTTRDRATNTYYQTYGYTISRIKGNGIYRWTTSDGKTEKYKSVNPDKKSAKYYDKLYTKNDVYYRKKNGERQTVNIYLPYSDKKQYCPGQKKGYDKQSQYGIFSAVVEADNGYKNGRHYTINTWVISLDNLLAYMYNTKGCKTWAKEFYEDMALSTAWLGVDAIQVVYVKGQAKKYFNYKSSPNICQCYSWVGKGVLTNQYGRFVNTKAESLPGGSDAKEDYSASSESMTIVKNLYDEDENSIPSTAVAGATEYADGSYYYGTSDNSSNKYSSPYTATFNVSNDWELGTAIPTSETYMNQIEQDSWYGTITLNHNTLTYDVTLRVSKPYRYWVTTRYGGYWVYGSYPVTMTYTFEADNYTINAMNLAQLVETYIEEVKNNNAEWDVDIYDRLNKNSLQIEMVVPTVSGGGFSSTLYTTGDPSTTKFLTVTQDLLLNYYMIFPTYEKNMLTNNPDYLNRITVSPGSIGSQCIASVKATADSAAKVLQREWTKNVTNDTLIINGVHILDGQFTVEKTGTEYKTPESFISETITEGSEEDDVDSTDAPGWETEENEGPGGDRPGHYEYIDDPSGALDEYGNPVQIEIFVPDPDVEPDPGFDDDDVYDEEVDEEQEWEEDKSDNEVIVDDDADAEGNGNVTIVYKEGPGNPNKNPEKKIAPTLYPNGGGVLKLSSQMVWYNCPSGKTYWESGDNTSGINKTLIPNYDSSVTTDKKKNTCVDGNGNYKYASGYKVTYPDVTSNNLATLTFEKKTLYVLPAQKWDTANDVIGDYIQDNDMGRVTSRVVTIPEKSENGIYYTRLTTVYDQVGYESEGKPRTIVIFDSTLTDEEYNTLKHTKNGASQIKWPAIKQELSSSQKTVWTYRDDDGNTKVNEPQKNEGIRVHSPVLSPVSIVGEEQTQLVNEDWNIEADGGAQLILDHTYTLTFDWDSYFKEKAKYVKGYVAPTGWAKYIEDKRIRFPYSVEIKSYTVTDPDTGRKTKKPVDQYYEPVYNANDTRGYYVDIKQYENIVGYDPTYAAGSDYTTWLVFPANTTEIEVYIPSWAKEGSYVTSNMYDSMSAYEYAQVTDANGNAGRPIQVEVRANNYTSESQNKVSVEYKNEVTGNTSGDIDSNSGHNGSNDPGNRTGHDNGGVPQTSDHGDHYTYYAASYEYPTEVSGIIYGFQIDAINNPVIFTGETNKEEDIDSLTNQIANLVLNKQEKNVGMTNRLGDSYLRYTVDGTLVNMTTEQEKNTLPLTSGKSDTTKNGGYLMRGNAFSFELKTIADLNEEDDKITIIPSYRYVGTDGNSTKNVAYYYTDEFLTKETETDSYYEKTALSDAWHDGCMYDYLKDTLPNANYDTTFYTAWYRFSQKYQEFTNGRNMAQSYLMTTKWNCYRMNKIEIPAGLRLFTGNEEELEKNLQKDLADVTRYTITGNTDLESTNNTGDFVITQSQYDNMADSMQTWYGVYAIPSSLKVVDVDYCKEYCEEKGYPWSNAEDPLWQYMDAKGDGVDPERDPVFINTGYLVLNFDIMSEKDDGSYKHLSYTGEGSGGLDIWTVEGGTNGTVTAEDVYPAEIPVGPGDVAIITLDSNYENSFTAGVIYAD